MTPTTFPEANCKFSAPTDMSTEQVGTIDAFVGTLNTGSLDGADAVVVAWKPDNDDIIRINNGQPVYISMIGGLLPHSISTKLDFKDL